MRLMLHCVVDMMRIEGQNKKMTAKKMLKRPEMKQLIEKVKM